MRHDWKGNGGACGNTGCTVRRVPLNRWNWEYRSAEDMPLDAAGPCQGQKPVTENPDSPGMASVVFRLPRAKLGEVKELVESTRVRQSEYLREAISDLLTKYEDSLR